MSQVRLMPPLDLENPTGAICSVIPVILNERFRVDLSSAKVLELHEKIKMAWSLMMRLSFDIQAR